MIAYKLFLDDDRIPEQCMQYHMPHMPLNKDIYLEDWVIVRNYDEFVNMIETRYAKGEFPWLISFDHDLAHEHYGAKLDGKFKEKTGAVCAKWLFNFCISNEIEIPKHYVHSMNFDGGNRIDAIMKDFHRYNEIMRKFPNDSDTAIDYPPIDHDDQD